MAGPLYKEKQRFKDYFVLTFLAISSLLLLGVAFTSMFNVQTSLTYAAFCFLLAVGLGGAVYWLRRQRYQLKVTRKSIKFRFSPIHRGTRKIRWKDVTACEIVQTPPSAQWHGGNLARPGENYFSFSGRNGLSLETQAGQQFFLGCSDVEKLRDSLDGVVLKLRRK